MSRWDRFVGGFNVGTLGFCVVYNVGWAFMAVGAGMRAKGVTPALITAYSDLWIPVIVLNVALLAVDALKRHREAIQFSIRMKDIELEFHREMAALRVRAYEANGLEPPEKPQRLDS